LYITFKSNHEVNIEIFTNALKKRKVIGESFDERENLGPVKIRAKYRDKDCQDCQLHLHDPWVIEAMN
jgi:hypothetical protein